MIWEHFNENWIVDQEYNKNDPKHLFKPYGQRYINYYSLNNIILL